MIEVRESKKNNAKKFPVIIELTSGELYFTVRAAKELRDKLASVVANIEQKAARP
ncbi:MAG: hypothetical protein KKB59_10425 [Spirochaetes bacterium]|nr:hypothetical protein [Spirochaetota bacterium]